MPVIDVTTSPAEFIQSDGEPEYTPNTGTNLPLVKNTRARQRRNKVHGAGRIREGRRLAPRAFPRGSFAPSAPGAA
jgi:hypothetical protein